METCSTCRFWIKPSSLIAGQQHGVCRRNPPVPMLLPAGGNSATLQAVYPVTKPKDWCGEHKPEANGEQGNG